MRLFRRADPHLDDDLRKLKGRLREALQPVALRPDFVSGLQSRLLAGDIQVIPPGLPRKISNGLLVAGGIFGSILMIMASIRGLLSLISVVGLVIQYLNKDSQGQQATPA